jgi:GNAT superfamily N-acetyltransferase
MRLGIAHHLGWAVAVTASADHRVVDRRRIELIEPGMPTTPIHHEGKPLDDVAAAELVAQVRASAIRATSAALDELATALPEPIVSMSLRAWPVDFPDDIAVQRRAPHEARADSVMYRQVLAELARARGWDVHLYDAKNVEGQAVSILAEQADDVLRGPRETLGPPWAKDHRMALAATIVAGADALVRSALVTDAEAVARTVNSSWRVGYRGLLPDAILDGLDDARSTAQWVQWLRDGYQNLWHGAEVRVATDSNTAVVGVSAFGADRDRPDAAAHGELWMLYVEPSCWGHGYGRALLRDAETTLAACGRNNLTLWVLDGNLRARRFYEAAGWASDDVTKLFGDSGAYEVRYRKHV